MFRISQKCAGQGEQIQVDDFLELMKGISGLVQMFGAVLSSAFSNVNKKIDFVSKNRDLLESLRRDKSSNFEEIRFLEQLIIEEVSLKVYNFNGSNNKYKKAGFFRTQAED